MKHAIKTETLQKVMALLATLPFQQVAGLIDEITKNAEEIKESPTFVQAKE